MAKATRATHALDRHGIVYTLHTYAYDADAPSIGLQAAAALGEPASRVYKTLMAELDGKAVCAVVPSDRDVSMKKLAAALGGKSAVMMKPADAERFTGYHVGGISPFGQKKQSPTAFEIAALDEPYIYVNGGQRGLQIRLAPAEAVHAAGALAVAIAH